MARIKLCSEEVKLMVKHRDLGRTNQQIAEMMGVTEGAVRYRVNKSRNPVPDRRRNRPSRVSNWRRVIERWFDGTSGSRRRPSMKVLYDHLCKNHGFGLSYSALRRWIRKTYPDWWKMKVRIRLEIPPGQLVQVDWKENILVRIADQVVRINVFIFELCFSRKSILLVSQRRDLPSCISAHQAAFRRLGGLPGFIRPDCMKTAVNKWRGFKSDLKNNMNAT